MKQTQMLTLILHLPLPAKQKKAYHAGHIYKRIRFAIIYIIEHYLLQFKVVHLIYDYI